MQKVSLSKFDRLVDEILEFLWKASPLSATFAGIHKYDHLLDIMEAGALEENNNRSKKYLEKLLKFNLRELSPDEYIDWRLLRNSLESNIKSFEAIRHWEKNPSIYPEVGLYSIFILMIREFAPLPERAESIRLRLQQIPRLLKEGQKNLKNPPEVFTKLALEVAEGGLAFFKSGISQISARVPKLKDELEKAATTVCQSYEEYIQFLKEKFVGKSRGSFAIGTELFNFKLDKDHMLPYKADELFEIGQDAKRMTEAELDDVARTIDRRKRWWEVVEDIKNIHPQASELLEVYKRSMLEAREFVKTKNLVTIPPGEELEVIPTPPFERPTIPYAAYMPPAPFEKKQKGFFYVTLVDENLPVKLQEEVLRGHPVYGIPIIALHEGYPGHHLQLVYSNRTKRKIRKLFGSSVFAEGWALYCEEMMAEVGFYSDPRTKLLKLKDQLWRACRIIIDIGLHTEKINFDEAVNILVNDAKLERVHAEKEVTRYTFTPTQPLSYLIGKKQILEFRHDYETKLGRSFRLKDFHDQLLSFGTIPVVLIREAMGV